MRNLVWTIAFLALAPRLSADTLDVVWARQLGGTDGELAYNVGADANGNTYVTGHFTSATFAVGSITLTNSNGGGTNNAYIAKLDPAGNVIWAINAAGNTESSSIAVDRFGNSYITGRYLSPTMRVGAITLTNGGTTFPIEMYAAKFDPNGNLVWANRGGGPGQDTGFAVAADELGNAYVTGWFRDGDATFGSVTLTNTGQFNWFVVKYDGTGNVVWAKSNTGPPDVQSKGIAVDRFGNVYVAGRYNGAPTFGSITLPAATDYDFLLVKYDSFGNALWARRAGGGRLDYGAAVTTDPFGNVYVTGYFESGSITFGTTVLSNAGVPPSAEVLTVKYDSNGNVLWARGGRGTADDEGRDIALDSFGNVWITGLFQSPTVTFDSLTLTNYSTSSDIFVVKYDAVGNVVDANVFGGNGGDAGRGIIGGLGGKVFFSGSFEGPANFGGTDLNGFGGTDAVVAELGAGACSVGPATPPNFLWARSAGSDLTENPGGVALDPAGNIYISGYFSSTISFGSTNLTSRGEADVFAAKYSPQGNFLWAKQIGGVTTDRVSSTAVDGANNIYVTGYFTNTVIIDGTNLVSSGADDIYLVKYDSSGALIRAMRAGGNAHDNSLGLEVDSGNHVYIGGYFRNTATFGSTSIVATASCTGSRSDAFVAKYDSSGNIVWAIGEGGCMDDVTYDVAVDPSGNVIAVGYFMTNANFSGTILSSAGVDDIFVAKYNAAQNLLWARRAGGGSSEKAHSVTTDSSGNVYVTGFFQSASAAFGSTNLSTSGSSDIFLSKYDSSGNLMWAKKAGGSGVDVGNSVLVDSGGNVYLSGRFQNIGTFDTTNLTSRGVDDIFLAKYNASGTLLWVTQFGGAGGDGGGHTAMDCPGNIYMLGVFSDSAIFGNDAFSSVGSTDIFLGKLGTDFVPRPPVLNITRSGNSVLLSWPTSFTGYQLQETTAFSSPTVWNNTGISPAVIGTNYIVSATLSGTPKFFRLVK